MSQPESADTVRLSEGAAALHDAAYALVIRAVNRELPTDGEVGYCQRAMSLVLDALQQYDGGGS